MDTKEKCQHIDFQDLCWRMNCVGCRFAGVPGSNSQDGIPRVEPDFPVLVPEQSTTVLAEAG